MLTVVAIMFLGIALGFLVKGKSRVVNLNNKLIMWAIYLLLFLLGVAIGTNELILNNLPNLGFKALLISTSCILGSVLVSWLGYLIWFKPKISKNEK